MQIVSKQKTVNNHRTALENVRQSLKQQFLERDEIIDGLLAGLLSKQHVLKSLYQGLKYFLYFEKV